MLWHGNLEDNLSKSCADEINSHNNKRAYVATWYDEYGFAFKIWNKRFDFGFEATLLGGLVNLEIVCVLNYEDTNKNWSRCCWCII